MESLSLQRVLLALVSLPIDYLLVQAIPSTNSRVRRQYDSTELKVDQSKHDEQFFTFLSRPDLDAPRWDLKLHNEEALAPGYWFTTAYGVVEQLDNADPYVGPYIYDNHGELVWSGAPLFDKFGTFDFKVSQLDGQDVISTIYPQGGAVYIINSQYERIKTLRVGRHDDPNMIDRKTVNIHDFRIVGDEFISLNRKLVDAPQSVMEEFGYKGDCRVQMNGFTRANMETGEVSFEWSPNGNLRYNESYLAPVKCRTDGWDYTHLNSVELLPDGHYLISARHVSGIYKVSSVDGHIMWRLNGKQSDFEWIDDSHFLGQHDARYLSHNETHMIISLMDNAIGPGTPKINNPCSRGLVLALGLTSNPMTVSEVRHYDHPQGYYATARGNFQTLPNGNAFIGWSDKAFHSEHSFDGELLMEAFLPSGLKSYRAYKFPWVGHPKSPPDVYSAAVSTADTTLTSVHVSWNGATEVASWKLYKTTRNGAFAELVASTEKDGFETALAYKGYARFVKVEAIDKYGSVLGSSRVIRTVEPHDMLNADVAKETQWLQDHNPLNSGNANWTPQLPKLSSGESVSGFVVGILVCVFAALGVWLFRRLRRRDSLAWRPRGQRYQSLLHGDGFEEDEGQSDLRERERELELEKLDAPDKVQ